MCRLLGRVLTISCLFGLAILLSLDTCNSLLLINDLTEHTLWDLHAAETASAEVAPEKC